MDLNRQCREVLRRVEAEAPVLDDPPSAGAMRALDIWRKQALAEPGPEVFDVRNVAVPTIDGMIECVLYRPTEETAPGVLVWLHGGGWVAGSPANSDDQARMLAVSSGCAVMSVDYRLAPEHRFPAAVHDCHSAVAWAAAHADTIGAEHGRLALGGDSAGGNLAAAVTLMARDRGGPSIDFQLLAYPVTCRDLQADSRERYAEGYWLTQDSMTWYWQEYLERDEDAARPYASPLLAQSLEGLPAAHIILAECDLLHDEGLRYAQRLRDAGVPVDLQTYSGMLHGFLACSGVVGAAQDALRTAGLAVQNGLSGTPKVLGQAPGSTAKSAARGSEAS